MRRYFDSSVEGAAPGEVNREEVYRRLSFPSGVDEPYRRPYTAINMVATVDGKVVIGGPGTTRLIGTPTDHYLMEKIESQADCVLLGARLVREDDPPYPNMTEERRARRRSRGLRECPVWAIVSTRGEFTRPPALLQGGRQHTAIFVTSQITASTKTELERTSRVFVAGEQSVEPAEMGRVLRDELDVQRMICLGGPALNATMIAAGAVDELFVTVAPQLQGGRGLATMIEGRGYPPAGLLQLELLSLYGDGSELYLRYKLPARG